MKAPGNRGFFIAGGGMGARCSAVFSIAIHTREVVDREVNPFYQGRRPIMGWQIPICQKERSSLKKVYLTVFAEINV